MREVAGAGCLALGFAAPLAQAADTALVYGKDYQCGTEIIHVGHCRRDSDMPGMPATTDADNYCQVYYPSRPKNGIGGTAFGTELRGDLEKSCVPAGRWRRPSPRRSRQQSQPRRPRRLPRSRTWRRRDVGWGRPRHSPQEQSHVGDRGTSARSSCRRAQPE
jgi:hypothetical protein